MIHSILLRSLLAACALAAVSQLPAQSKPERVTLLPTAVDSTKTTASARKSLAEAIELLEVAGASKKSRAKALKMLEAAMKQLSKGNYEEAKAIYSIAKKQAPDSSGTLVRVLKGVADESSSDGRLARLLKDSDIAKDLLHTNSRIQDDKKRLEQHVKELTDRKRALELSAAALTERAHALQEHAHEAHAQDPQKLPDAKRKTKTVVEWFTDKKQTEVDKKKAEAALQKALEYVDRTQRSEALRKAEKEHDVFVTRMTQAKAAKANRDAEVEYRIQFNKELQEVDRVKAEIEKSLARTDPSAADKAGNVYLGTYVDDAGRVVASTTRSGDFGALRALRRLPMPDAEGEGDDDDDIVEAINGVRAELRAIRKLMERVHGAMDHDDDDDGKADDLLSSSPYIWIDRSRAENHPKGGDIVWRVRDEKKEEEKGEGSGRFFFDVKVDPRNEGEGAWIEVKPEIRRKIEGAKKDTFVESKKQWNTAIGLGSGGGGDFGMAAPAKKSAKTKSAPNAVIGLGGGGFGMEAPAPKPAKTKAESAPKAVIGIGSGGRFRVIKETAPEPTKATKKAKRRYIR